MRYYLLLLVTNRIIILLTESRLTEQKHLTVRQTERISISFPLSLAFFAHFLWRYLSKIMLMCSHWL